MSSWGLRPTSSAPHASVAQRNPEEMRVSGPAVARATVPQMRPLDMLSHA
jgi:hypothetical protein